MPAVVVNAPPFVVQHPLIKVGPTGSEVEFECAATNLDVNVDQDDNTVQTFCGTYTSFKAEKWTITVSVGMSYGTAGLWNNLRPLANTLQPFSIQPDSAVVSPDNPGMTGTAFVSAFPFISAAPGEASEVDVVLAVQGAPTFDDVGGGATTTEATAPAKQAA